MMQNTFVNHLSGGLSPETFIISNFIDKGSYGRVFKCHSSTNPSKSFAVKSITVSNGIPAKRHEEQVQEIQHELQILQKIEETSPKPSSILPFHGHYILENAYKDQDFCFVFDFLDKNFKTLIEENLKSDQAFSISELMKFYKQILHGMTFLQSFKVTHRDLKPGNLLLDAQNNIKIIDFGISVNITDLMKKDLQNQLSTLAAQTKFDMEIIGTKLYFSPEVLQKWLEIQQNPNAKIENLLNPYKSDVFSMGLIILEAGTSIRLKHDDDLSRLQQKIQDHLQIFSQKHQNLQGNQLKEFKFLSTKLARCLSMNVDNRPDFLTLFKEDLNEEKIPYHISVEEMSLDENREHLSLQNVGGSSSAEVEALKKEKGSLKKEMDKIEKVSQQKSAEVEALNKEIISLKEEMKKKEGSLKEEMEKIKKISKQKSAELEALNKEIISVNEEMKKSQQKKELSNAEVDSLKKENGELKEEMAKLKQKNNACLIQNDEFKIRIIELEDALKQFNKEKEGKNLELEWNAIALIKNSSFLEKIAPQCQGLNITQQKLRNLESFQNCGGLYNNVKDFSNMQIAKDLRIIEIIIKGRTFKSKADFCGFCDELGNIKSLEKANLILNNNRIINIINNKLILDELIANNDDLDELIINDANYYYGFWWNPIDDQSFLYLIQNLAKLPSLRFLSLDLNFNSISVDGIKKSSALFTSEFKNLCTLSLMFGRQFEIIDKNFEFNKNHKPKKFKLRDIVKEIQIPENLISQIQDMIKQKK